MRYSRGWLLRVPFRQAIDDLHRLDADPDHLADQTNDIFRVLGAVGIGADAAALVLGDLLLVDNPIKSTSVAEAVFEHLRWNAGER